MESEIGRNGEEREQRCQPHGTHGFELLRVGILSHSAAARLRMDKGQRAVKAHYAHAVHRAVKLCGRRGASSAQRRFQGGVRCEFT